MSLSYLLGFLGTSKGMDASKYLQSYYFNNASENQALLWDKEQLSK
ncbi:hypothetical protein [Faecalimicrobium sp. JNUCC 81]